MFLMYLIFLLIEFLLESDLFVFFVGQSIVFFNIGYRLIEDNIEYG